MGLGQYFLDSIYADIDALEENAGIHTKVLEAYHRAVATKFPYVIFYVVDDEAVISQAIFDCRRNPYRLQRRLR